MKKLARSKFSLWSLVISLLFVIASSLIPRVELMTILNGVFLGVVVSVMIVYSPLLWVSIRSNKGDRVSQLAMGIGLLWVSIAGQRLYWIIWHANGAPQSWQSNPFLSALVLISIAGGCLFVTAPGYPPETEIDTVAPWGENRKLLLIFGTLGGFATFLISIVTGNGF